MIALAALLLAGAPAQSVADAERAFAAAAQAEGQWTAFRATADPHAVMYAPGPVNAQAFLAGRANPPTHLSWRPAHTITSCDGTLAYSTGPWTAGAKSGSFGTVWHHGADGWRWLYDNGHDGGVGFAGGAVVEDKAACPGPVGAISGPPDDSLPDPRARKIGGEFGGVGFNAPIPTATLRKQALATLIEASDGPMPLSFRLGTPMLASTSTDRTLVWRINVLMGGKPNAHLLRVWSWDGRRYRLAVLDYSDGS
jgi:hypothetical protein